MPGTRTDRVEIRRGFTSAKWRWEYVRGNGVVLAWGASSGHVRRSAALQAAAHVLGGDLDVSYGAENRVHGWIRRPPIAPGLPGDAVEVVQR